MNPYAKIFLNKVTDKDLILWLTDQKVLFETFSYAAKRKLYMLMRAEKAEEREKSTKKKKTKPNESEVEE